MDRTDVPSGGADPCPWWLRVRVGIPPPMPRWPGVRWFPCPCGAALAVAADPPLHADHLKLGVELGEVAVAVPLRRIRLDALLELELGRAQWRLARLGVGEYEGAPAEVARTRPGSVQMVPALRLRVALRQKVVLRRRCRERPVFARGTSCPAWETPSTACVPGRPACHRKAWPASSAASSVEPARTFRARSGCPA
jgi:hypothetical protein